MKPNIILMNFTHVYEQERFINDGPTIHLYWDVCQGSYLVIAKIVTRLTDDITIIAIV